LRFARRSSCFADRAEVSPLVGVFFRDRAMCVRALYNGLGILLAGATGQQGCGLLAYAPQRPTGAEASAVERCV
jgi:hypothetical protein